MAIRLLLCLLLLTGCAAVEEPTPEGPLNGVRLVEALQDGGLVVFLRHTETAPGKDADPIDLDDCSTQRALSEQGRQDARDIGAAFKALDLEVGDVLASPYCRTVETAELAFGDVTKEEELLPFPGPGEPGHEEAVERGKALVATEPDKGKNTVLVSHSSTIEPITGATPEEGGAALFEPDGDGGFRLVAEVPPGGWTRLAEMSG